MKLIHYFPLIAVACLMTGCKTVDMIRDSATSMFGGSSEPQTSPAPTPSMPEIASNTDPHDYLRQAIDYIFRDSQQSSLSSDQESYGCLELYEGYRVPIEKNHMDYILRLRKSMDALCTSKQGTYRQDGACVAPDGKNIFLAVINEGRTSDVAIGGHFPPRGKTYLDSVWQKRSVDHLREWRNGKYYREGYKKSCAKMPVTAFGLTLNVTTLPEFQKKYPNAYLRGPDSGPYWRPYVIPVTDIKFKGLKEVIAYFSSTDSKLKEIKATFSIEDHDRIYGALKKKYKLGSTFAVTRTYENESGKLSTRTEYETIDEVSTGTGTKTEGPEYGSYIRYCDKEIMITKLRKNPNVCRVRYQINTLR